MVTNGAVDNQAAETSETWRVFAAVPVNDAVRDLMRTVQRDLQQHAWPVKWVDPDLAHITVRFFGELPQETIAALDNDLARAATVAGYFSPIELSLGGVPRFIGTRHRPPVIVIGLDGRMDADGPKVLARLAEDIRTHVLRLGLPGDNRRFLPHVTIGRFRNGTSAPPDADIVLRAAVQPSVTLPVERLQLIRSVLGQRGPTYTTIAEWPLLPTVPTATEPAPELREHG